MQSMPTPVMAQPIIAAPGEATIATFCGSAKMPAPTHEPTMRLTSVPIRTVRSSALAGLAVPAAELAVLAVPVVLAAVVPVEALVAVPPPMPFVG